MNHDVFICYDDNDLNAAGELTRIFEDNSIECWFKKRDFSSSGRDVEVFEAIEKAKAFVLVYSRHARDSEIVLREVNKFFGSAAPIYILNVDGSSIAGKMEFYLKGQPEVDLYPNPSKKLKSLIGDVSQSISKPVSEIKVSSKHFRQTEPRGERIKKYVKIAVPVAVILILIFWFAVIPSGQHTTSDGSFFMNVTDVDVSEINGKHVYTVYGDAYNMPSDSERYVMQLKFYDGEGSNVYDINATCDEFRGGVIVSFDFDDADIESLSFELVDFNDNEICSQNYTLN